MAPKPSDVRRHFSRSRRYLDNRSLIEGRVKLIGSILGDVTHSRILDVGCGDGSLSLQFASADNEHTLVDLSPDMVEEARLLLLPGDLRTVTLIVGDFLQLPISGSFDIVMCVGVLAHVSSVVDTIGKLASLCSPGATCIIQISDSSNFLGGLAYRYGCLHQLLFGRTGYVTNRTSERDVVEVAAQHGLTLASRVRYSFVLPGMRRLPVGVLRRFESSASDRSWSSRWGAESLLEFRRSAC